VKKTKKLRKLFNQPEIIIAPGEALLNQNSIKLLIFSFFGRVYVYGVMTSSCSLKVHFVLKEISYLVSLLI